MKPNPCMDSMQGFSPSKKPKRGVNNGNPPILTKSTPIYPPNATK